ncbi:FGGY family carbohydrate kinase [Microbacterium sp. Mu-80]|uniref:FGGY family carbohydrate kinase n=1 Tax=Microbacterium bandirmense TaxID=3122050 RepID=A0ABU8LF74_9MICO
MPEPVTLGVDIGTSSSKGVLVDAGGRIVATAVASHDVERPRSGWVEMDAEVWWREFIELTRRLLDETTARGLDLSVTAVGVSGMGPCVLLTDEDDVPVRPAILYGVDTRAGAQIDRMTRELGTEEITRIGGSRLSSQAAGPKIVWIADTEPDLYERSRRLFMPASWLVRKLTDEYVLDHQSASQVSPLYNVDAGEWHTKLWTNYAPGIEPPALAWAGDIAGLVTDAAAAMTGLRPGIPVITGTIDAWAEAVSVGAHGVGDLMLMYGTTMFLVATGTESLRTPTLWTTVGALRDTRNLAGGLATSGALTAWLNGLVGADYGTLLAEAEESGPGARGLLMLPYFAGERTPILDPDARGVIAGLTLEHTRGDLYRAALEATALGVRHNVETMRAAGADIRRIVAVGGGTQGTLWLQIVSDVTGLAQEVPEITIGASYGAAFLAASAVSSTPPRIEEWNPTAARVEPTAQYSSFYDGLFARYLRLYDSTSDVVHALAAWKRDAETCRINPRLGSTSLGTS